MDHTVATEHLIILDISQGKSTPDKEIQELYKGSLLHIHIQTEFLTQVSLSLVIVCIYIIQL